MKNMGGFNILQCYFKIKFPVKLQIGQMLILQLRLPTLTNPVTPTYLFKLL